MNAKLKKGLLTTMAALAATVLLGAGSSRAADMCMRDDYNSTLVFKKFKFPRAGDCKPVNGYELGTNCVISGTACATSNNIDVRFNLNVACPFGYMGTHSFRIDRLYSDLNQAGFGYACSPNTASGSWTCTQWHINTITCPNPRPLN
ncbi:MAG: hypothetical protein AB1689_06430 [Thermodesulfobacteriota bacterium]